LRTACWTVEEALDRRLPRRHQHTRADQHREHAFRLVGLDKPHAAHIGGKVEDRAHVAHRGAACRQLAQIGTNILCLWEYLMPLGDGFAVYDPDVRTSSTNKIADQMTADKSTAAGDQDLAGTYIHAISLIVITACPSASGDAKYWSRKINQLSSRFPAAHHRTRGKVSADRFDLPAKLYLGQSYEKSRIAEVAVVFRNFVLEHEVITEGVVGEFGHQSVVLMSVALPMSQDDRRIEIAFDRLEAILDLGSLKREVPVAEIQHLDLLFRNVFEEGGRAAPRLRPAQTDTTEDDPS
jgi:hypothetical protein